MVVVPKKGGKWRVCVNYTDLNEACPKDSFPLSRINQIMDATTGHGILSFLEPSLDTIIFLCICLTWRKQPSLCYIAMPFSLKKAGATCQRMMTKIFRPLIGKSMEVYIDDMLVKSKESPDHTRYLQETFELLRRHNMKLNPFKCTFSANSGKFLGFMVTQRGIEANPI